MWNKIACNQILLKKSQEKVRFIQQNSLRNTKSSLRSTNFSRTIYRPSPVRPRALKAQRDSELSSQNIKLATKLLQLKKSRSYSVVSKTRQSPPLLKLLQNNKRKLVQIKQKELQSQNKKLFEKILNVNSNLKDIRKKLHKNAFDDRPRNKTIVALSSIENGERKMIRHSKTQTIPLNQIQSKEMSLEKYKNFTSISEQVVQQIPNEGIQEIIE